MGNRGMDVDGSCDFDLNRSSDPLSVFALLSMVAYLWWDL